MQNVSHVKELFAHTIVYGLGIILNKSLNFILLPVYTKYFTPEEVGLFTLVYSLMLFTGIIYTFGLETSFIRFFIDSENESEKNEYYSSSIASLFITSIIFSIFIYIYSESISGFFHFDNPAGSTIMIKLASIYMIIDTVCRFPLLLFRAKLDTRNFSLLNLITFISNLASNIVLIVILKQGVESIFYCMIFSSAITLLAGLLMTRRYLTLRISVIKIKTLFNYGYKFIFTGIFLILIEMSDRFFLKYFFSEGIVGIYSANYRLASVMGLAISAFRFSWTPYFFNLKNNPENKKIISSVFTYFMFAGLMLFLLISLTADQLVRIDILGFSLLDGKFRSGTGILPLVLLSYLFSGIYSVFNAAPFLNDKTSQILIMALSGFIINTLFNLLLIPDHGIYGAAAATLITYAVMTLIVFYYSQKIYKIEYQWIKIAVMSLIALLIFITGYFIIDRIMLPDMFKILINILLVILSFSIMNLFKIIDLKKVSILWRKTH
ncbi:MAG: hypothetical protein HGGPFJEG_01222 [Ignavibacteria bacterium]|nr:hypothetical protein [Ignavibacteria bacterium]